MECRVVAPFSPSAVFIYMCLYIYPGGQGSSPVFILPMLDDKQTFQAQVWGSLEPRTLCLAVEFTEHQVTELSRRR